jgi:hypothetical protein
MSDEAKTRISELNDLLRRTGRDGAIVCTPGVFALAVEAQAEIMAAVVAFHAFDADNDPHSEHDFGALEIAGNRLFWKIDYYNLTLTAGSEDPSDPQRTRRVLTIMLAEEY